MTAVQTFVEAHQAGIGLLVLVGMLVAFVSERHPAAVVAVAGTCVYLALGLLEPETLFEVFSNPAPITIAAMFILSGALVRTGAIDAAAKAIVARARKHPRLATAELFLGIFFASAFMNNTPVVMILIPIMVKLSEATGYSLQRLLIPLSYCAIMGGMLTLIGTSTNLLVDGVARSAGMERFGIFEMTPYGLVAAASGVATMLLLGRWLLPKGDSQPLYRSAEHTGFLTELRVTRGSEAAGRRLGTLATLKRLSVLAIRRDQRFLRRRLDDEVLQENDRLVVRAELPELLSLAESKRWEIGVARTADVKVDPKTVVEATVSPNHPNIGQRLAEIPFLSALRVRILGVTRPNHIPGPNLADVRIRGADRLLVTGSPDQVRRMQDNPNLIGVGQTSGRGFRRGKAPLAIAAIAAVVLLAAIEAVPIAVAAIFAVGIILLTRCMDADEAWGSIDGNVLVLIFAMLAVGAALEGSGSLRLIIDRMMPFFAGMPPWALIFLVYFVSSLFTEVVTNNAVAVVMTPIAIVLAEQVGVDPRPLVLAVMLAASASFATPIGYQTNTLVYAAGGYRFMDFARIGVAMNVVVGIATCTALAMLY